jgi:hypothetical protein
LRFEHTGSNFSTVTIQASPNEALGAQADQGESATSVRLLANASLTGGSLPYFTPIDTSKTAWQLKMGPGGEDFDVQYNPVSGSPTLLFAISENGNVAISTPQAKLVLSKDATHQYSAVQMDSTGNLILGPTNLTSNAVLGNNLLDVSGQSGTTGGIIMKVVAGVPTDANFTNPVNGIMAIDSTDSKIYVRIGGAWKGVGVA